MDIESVQATFQVPSFARKEVYDFDTTGEALDVYRELSQIAEELEECRSRNS